MKGGKNVYTVSFSQKRLKFYRIDATQSHALLAIMTKLHNLGRHQNSEKADFPEYV